jgi:Restriction endonuclease S subunits
MPEARPPLVPELRFPDFRDAGPWEVKRLGELVETVTPPKKLQTSEYLPSGRFPIIDQSPSDVCGWTDDETALVQADFPLVVFGDHSCVVKLADGPFAQGADGIRILAPTSDIEARFLFLSLQADPIEQKGYRRHFSTLKEKQIPFPGKDTGEQQKIADCLSSLDDLIRAEEGRLEALRAHKTGLMQRLFPAPGQTTPRLRFPEFQNAGPWEVKRLGEIAEINPSTGPLPPNFVYIDLESVVGGELVQKKHISRKGAPSRAQRVLKVGDVIYQMVRPYQMNNLLFEMDDGQEYVASTGYAQLRAEGSSTFLYQLIHTTPFTNSVLEKCTGSNYPAISSSDLADLRTRVPALPEQQKIADCLTALDDLIRAQGETIEALKTHKRGLMNRLFPREVD